MKILSCNIRKSDAEDGANAWEFRRDFCLTLLKQRRPEIICFQEMREDQFLDVRNAFPGFNNFGMTKTATCYDPINAIFYRRERFELVSAGGYWLSETPHVAGSQSWQSASIRLANWVRLRDRQTQNQFRILNTHLDHISGAARKNQMRMILFDACIYPEDFPQLMTGDLNVDQSDPLIEMIREADWWDTYQKAHLPVDPGNTYHGFSGDGHRTEQGKIDWIFAKGEIIVEEAHILRDHQNGRYPSDHYFVEADVHLFPKVKRADLEDFEAIDNVLAKHRSPHQAWA